VGGDLSRLPRFGTKFKDPRQVTTATTTSTRKKKKRKKKVSSSTRIFYLVLYFYLEKKEMAFPLVENFLLLIIIISPSFKKERNAIFTTANKHLILYHFNPPVKMIKPKKSWHKVSRL
jgi:hypothetical protein